MAEHMTPGFRALGKPNNQPSKDLDTFPKPDHVTKVTFTSEELSSLCPVTGQPDFNTVEIEFHPQHLCIESKSLKLYLWTFRDEAIFGEALAGTIAADICAAINPLYCKVTLNQGIRGGIRMTAVAEINKGAAN